MGSSKLGGALAFLFLFFLCALSVSSLAILWWMSPWFGTIKTFVILLTHLWWIPYRKSVKSFPFLQHSDFYLTENRSCDAATLDLFPFDLSSWWGVFIFWLRYSPYIICVATFSLVYSSKWAEFYFSPINSKVSCSLGTQLKTLSWSWCLAKLVLWFYAHSCVSFISLILWNFFNEVYPVAFYQPLLLKNVV